MNTRLLAATLLVALTTTLCAQRHDRSSDLVAVARSAGFDTLVAALKAADLDDAIADGKAFTVFAPTDEAFAALGGTLQELLKPKNKARLQQILKYHVVAGRQDAAAVLSTSALPSLAGLRLAVERGADGPTVAGGRLLKTDVAASNGIIHVIDRVLVPTDKTVVAVASAAGQFKTLLAAAKSAGLVGLLTSDGPFTVLAPTDAAFSKLGHDALQRLLKPASRAELQRILAFHVLPGRLYAAQALGAGPVETKAGENLSFALTKGRLTVQGARVLQNDIPAANGLIHIIDRVILPPAPKPTGEPYYGVVATQDLKTSTGESVLVITRIVPGNGAEAAGLEVGDLIQSIAGKQANQKQLRQAKLDAGIGNTVEFRILRNGERKRIKVKLGARPKSGRA